MENNQFIFTSQEQLNAVLKQLRDLPQAIYNAECALANARQELSIAKLTLTTNEAAEFLTADGKTVKDKESLVAQKVEELERTVIKKEVDLLKAEATYNKAVNDFAAVRKEAGLLEAMLQSKI